MPSVPCPAGLPGKAHHKRADRDADAGIARRGRKPGMTVFIIRRLVQSGFDRTVMTGSILGFSLPSFWQGMMLIMVFSVMLGWLPSTGRGATGEILGLHTSLATWDGFTHLVLPAINLSLFNVSLIIRLT